MITPLCTSCGAPPVIELQAQASSARMWLCRAHAQSALELPQLSEKTKNALRLAISRSKS